MSNISEILHVAAIISKFQESGDKFIIYVYVYNLPWTTILLQSTTQYLLDLLVNYLVSRQCLLILFDGWNSQKKIRHFLSKQFQAIMILWTMLNKTFKKRKNRAFLTLSHSQKHYVIFSNNVLEENITRKQFNRWLGLVLISQTALRYLQPRSKGTWERGWDTLWCAHKENTDYRPKHWKSSI